MKSFLILFEKQHPAHSFGRALRTPGMLAYTGLCAALILVVTFLT